MYGIRCQSVEVVTNNLIKQQLPVRFTFGFECFIVVLSFSGLCVLCLFMHCSRISPDAASNMDYGLLCTTIPYLIDSCCITHRSFVPEVREF